MTIAQSPFVGSNRRHRIRRRLRHLRTDFVHRWHAAQTIGEWFGNDQVGHRFEHINHLRSLAQYIWRFGAFRERDDGTGRIPVDSEALGLGAIVRPIARRGREHFENAVLYAARYGDAPPQSVASSGQSGDSVHAEVAGLVASVGRYPDIPLFARRLTELHRAMLNYQVQMRVLTEREADRYRRGPFPILSGLSHRPHPAELRQGPLGRDRLPADLSAALLATFSRDIYRALCCRARSELFETLFARKLQANDHFQANDPPPSNQSSHARSPARRHDARAIAEPHSESSRPGSNRPEPRHRPAQRDDDIRTRTVVRGVLVGGKRMSFVVHDPALASMLNSLVEGPMPRPVRWAAAFKMAVSAMITALPVFIVKNFFRDTLAGFVAGRYWQKPFVGTLGGAMTAIRDMRRERRDLRGDRRRVRDSDPMHDYLLQGGFYSGLVESETHLAPARDEEGRVRKHTALARIWAKTVHLVTRPAWFSEAGTRVDQFRRARREGATLYQASRAARMVSSDFANIGASRHWRCYVHTVPFLNAAIQGLDQLYQIGRLPMRSVPNSRRRNADERAHLRKVILAGGTLALASCALWIFNAGNEARRDAYHAETDYEKASWVTLYDVAGDADLRIPVPFQIGALFMKAPEIVLDLGFGRETLAGPKFGWSLVHGNLAVGLVPAPLQPVWEIARNRNFFGDEIIPAYMANWEPRDQFFDRSTPLPYRRVGDLINRSPLHVQTFVRGWTGHLGNLAVTGLDEAMWDEEANGPKPFPRSLRLATGVHSLFPPRPRTYTRFGDEFYEISDWADGRARRASCGGSGSVPAVCRARTLASRTAREASNLRRRGDAIRTDATRTRAEKEAELEDVYAEIDQNFRAVLPELRELRRLEFALVGPAEVLVGGAGQSAERPESTWPGTEVQPGECIDVNAASATELQRLRGIGPVISGRIVAERGRGRFRNADDLQRVRGIGPKTVENLRRRVCGG